MKQWTIVVALVVGIMIGSLTGNPFKGEAVSSADVNFLKKRDSCFAVFKSSITFVKRGGCPK